MRSLSCGMTLPLRLYVAGLAEKRISTSISNCTGIAADLHVALFENVEQADLHQFVEFRQFVHRENAAVHARNEAEVQGFFGAMLVPPASLAGSISPMMSANFVPGASRSA